MKREFFFDEVFFQIVEELFPLLLDKEERLLFAQESKRTAFLLSFKEQIQKFKEYALAVLASAEAGVEMTEPLYFYGLKTLPPNANVTYSKPITLLVDELCFSCGDLFPAILQDAGRVTVVGKKTAGAGGHVLGGALPNKYGVEFFRYTASIGERPYSSQKIENLGVMPDIPYMLTEKDIKNDYINFRKVILKTLNNKNKD